MVGRIKAYLYAIGFTACIFTSNNTSFSQDAIVNDYLTLVARGKVQDVKSKLPDLMVEYPNNAGVKLLLAVVLEDASKSVDIYKEIVKNYPDNIWADDAYWRLIQYYAITGDITKAKEELENFRNNYPTSPFLVSSGETVRFAESVIKSNAKLSIKSDNNKAETGEYSELKVTPKVKEEEDHSNLSDGYGEKQIESNSVHNIKTNPEPKLENKLDKFKPKTQSLEEVVKQNEINTIDAKRPNLHLSANTDITNNESHHDDDGHHSEGNHEIVELKGESHNNEDNHGDVNHDEMSLEDEIKIRQNISKSLANDKLTNEKLNSGKLANEKNPLQEKPSTTTLTKVEGHSKEEHNTEEHSEEAKAKTYGLQVSIYSSQETAELEMKKYLKQRMRTEVKSKTVDGNKMYAVVIGNYSSRESAEGARGIVEQQCNCSPIIFEK